MPSFNAHRGSGPAQAGRAHSRPYRSRHCHPPHCARKATKYLIKREKQRKYHDGKTTIRGGKPPPTGDHSARCGYDRGFDALPAAFSQRIMSRSSDPRHVLVALRSSPLDRAAVVAAGALLFGIPVIGVDRRGGHFLRPEVALRPGP